MAAISRYRIIENLLPASVADNLRRHVIEISDLESVKAGDRQVPGSPAAYADPVTERLLSVLLPQVEAHTQARLFPTYSYWRLYKKGAILSRHKDRPACEISLTISLGYEPEEAWPIWLEDETGPVGISLRKGDALLYRGSEIYHWREQFTGSYAAQLFLHYVYQDGPHELLKYDGRTSLRMG